MRVICLAAILVLPAMLNAQTPPAASPAAPRERPPLLRSVSPSAPRQLTLEEEMAVQWTYENRNQPRACVDNQLITLHDVRKASGPALVVHRREAQSQAEFNQRRDMVMIEMIQSIVDYQKLFLVEYRERSQQPVPKSYVARQIEEKIQRQHHGDKNEYLTILERFGITPLEDRRQMEEEIVASAVRDEILKSCSETSPQKIVEYYKAHLKENYTRTEQVRYRHIFLTPGAAETETEVRALARQIVEEARKGATSFEELARRHNRDAGGTDEWRNVADVNERTVAAIKALPDGGITDVLDFTPPGGRPSLYIFQRQGYREGGLVPLDEVQDTIAFELLSQERKAVLEDWQRRARQRYFVRFY